MSIVEDVPPVGVRPAERRPVRALALLGVSRVVSATLVMAVVWVGHVVLSQPPDAVMHGRPLVIIEPLSEATTGVSVAGLIEDVHATVARLGGSLVDLELEHRGGGAAAVRFTADLPGESAATVDRLVATLERTELAGMVPRSVDPVPSGLRVAVDAEVELAPAAPDAGVSDGRATAVVLAEVAEHVGVQLRGVDVPPRTQDPVRVTATGRLDAVVDLIDGIEQEYSAPLRFRSVSVRRTAAQEHEAVLLFLMREDVRPPHLEVRP